jgi:hypothetical protein
MSPSRTPVTHQPDARSGRRNRKPPVQNIRVQAVSSTRRNHRVNAGVQLQRSHARRTAQRDAVPQPRACPRRDHCVGGRLQPGTAALVAWIQNTGGIRRGTGQAMACFATPCGLRYEGHCHNRAHAQQNRLTLTPAGGKLGVTSHLTQLSRFAGPPLSSPARKI